MISNNRFFRIAMLFAITEIAKITIAPTVYTAIFNEEAAEIIRFGNIGITVSTAVFFLTFIILRRIADDGSVITFTPSAAFFIEFATSAMLLSVYKAKEMAGLPSGFILISIAAMSALVYLMPFIISEIMFLIGYLMANLDKDHCLHAV